MARPQLSLGVTIDKNRSEILKGDWPTIRENADRLFGNGGGTPPTPAPTPGTRGPMSAAHKAKIAAALKKRQAEVAKGKAAAAKS